MTRRGRLRRWIAQAMDVPADVVEFFEHSAACDAWSDMTGADCSCGADEANDAAAGEVLRQLAERNAAAGPSGFDWAAAGANAKLTGMMLPDGTWVDLTGEGGGADARAESEPREG